MAQYPDPYVDLCYKVALLDHAISSLDDLAPPEGSSITERPELFSPLLPRDISQVSTGALHDVILFLREEVERMQSAIDEYTVSLKQTSEEKTHDGQREENGST